MNDLFTKYQNEVIPKLREDFNLKNNLAVPQLEKIVLNVGVAEAITNEDVLEKVKEQLGQISGQRPRITRAQKAISTFKLKANDPIGVMVTLRNKKAWDFLQKLIAIVIPRMRDFRGLSPTKFDQKGNYSLGITEQTLFPEVDYSKVDKTRGLVATIVIRNSDKEKSQKMLELLGVPFRNE